MSRSLFKASRESVKSQSLSSDESFCDVFETPASAAAFKEMPTAPQLRTSSNRFEISSIRSKQLDKFAQCGFFAPAAAAAVVVVEAKPASSKTEPTPPSGKDRSLAILRSIEMNRKCREDLLELRRSNVPAKSPVNPSGAFQHRRLAATDAVTSNIEQQKTSVKNGHEPAPSPRLKKRNHSSSIISADADCASDQTKASRYKTWPFLPRGGSGAVSSKAEAIRHFLESLDLKANSGDTKPALSKKESRGLEISKAASKISDEGQHRSVGNRKSSHMESCSGVDAALKQSMSFLNKSGGVAGASEELINPVDKQIAEIFMINSLQNEMPSGGGGASGGVGGSCGGAAAKLAASGVHRTGSERKHNNNNNNWLQELNEEDRGQYLDELGESVDDYDDDDDCKSANRDYSIGDDFNAENVNPNSISGTEFPKEASPKSSKSDKSKKYSTGQKLRRAFSKISKAVKQVQFKAEDVLNQSDPTESESDDPVPYNEASRVIKYKSARRNKNASGFSKTHILQIINTKQAGNEKSEETNPGEKSIIWSIKFSPCGKLLGTAGKDQILRIWVLKSYYLSLLGLMKKYKKSDEFSHGGNELPISTEDQPGPFLSKPFISYHGHTADILDISWSKNLFILSASSDKTCRLWHVFKSECLCIFYHSSIVSTISFHPKDDRYFVSGCLDGKLRVWNTSDKKVVLWNELAKPQSSTNFITAICFCQSGRTIAVGTYDGKCILYQTEHLKYYSLINIRSNRRRYAKGSKITGIEVLNNDENKILVTSNDSRIRLYDLRDLSLVCKYKGFSNPTVHIKASISPDDKFIIIGSENKCTYIWKTNHQTSMLISGRRDRNMFWERIQAHNAIVTCAVFCPNPKLLLESVAKSSSEYSKALETDLENKHVFVSTAGCDGVFKVILNIPEENN